MRNDEEATAHTERTEARRRFAYHRELFLNIYLCEKAGLPRRLCASVISVLTVPPLPAPQSDHSAFRIQHSAFSFQPKAEMNVYSLYFASIRGIWFNNDHKAHCIQELCILKYI